jgi:DNA polymerase sigma
LSSFKSTNNKSVGQLWFEFLDFFGSKFDASKTIVSIRRLNGISKAESNWKMKRLTIEG